MSSFDSAQFLKALSVKWSAKYECDPDAQDRIARGLEIALAGKVAPRDAVSYRVAGSKKGVEYVVKTNGGWPSCDCPDFEFSHDKTRCKHIWAVAMMARLAAEIVSLMSQSPKPKVARKPRANDLSRRCAAHNNHEQTESTAPLARVIPFSHRTQK